MSTSKEDTGIIQADYLLNGATQKLHYRKTSSGVFIYGSSSAVSMTNQIETVIKFLVSKKIMDENHTSTGKCLYYRNSESRWDQALFHRNNKTGVFFVDWPRRLWGSLRAGSALTKRRLCSPCLRAASCFGLATARRPRP